MLWIWCRQHLEMQHFHCVCIQWNYKCFFSLSISEWKNCSFRNALWPHNSLWSIEIPLTELNANAFQSNITYFEILLRVVAHLFFNPANILFWKVVDTIHFFHSKSRKLRNLNFQYTYGTQVGGDMELMLLFTKYSRETCCSSVVFKT